MIDIKKISFSYGEKTVFKDFSLKINSGDKILLNGASGSGKTTLLKLITGLEKVQSGEIDIEKNAAFSCVFQEDRLLPHHTVLQNLTLFGDKKTAEELLEKLNLSGDKNRYPQQLSGGMARRVAIARALIKKADIYIFDEPFNGLDAAAAENAAKLINNCCADKTVIIVSHNAEAKELFNARVAEL